MHHLVTFLPQLGELGPFSRLGELCRIAIGNGPNPILQAKLQRSWPSKFVRDSVAVKRTQQDVAVDEGVYKRNGGLEVRPEMPGAIGEVVRTAETRAACGSPIEKNIIR